MKEQKRKYDRPLMERVLVELEDGFCAGSANVQNGSETKAGINAHEVNTDFTTDFIGNNEPGIGTNAWD